MTGAGTLETESGTRARKRTGKMTNSATQSTREQGVNGAAAKDDEGQGLKGDYGNIALLLLLYMLQGVPLGLSQTMDLTLQEKTISYEEQGIFGSVSWPYSLKLLWAPLVDALYVRRFGRRKTWLVPMQLLLGFMLLLLPDQVMELLGTDADPESGHQGRPPQVVPLTVLFFIFYLLAATQDVALDGWAVTMLAKRNLGWASTCNVVGQTVGFFLSFTGFLALKSYNLVTLPGFMQAWGVIFLVTTVLVWIFKHERDELAADGEGNDTDLSVLQAYKQMWQVLTLANVKSLLIIMFTRGVAFAAADNLAQRKLVEKGMQKEHVASLMILVTPLSIVLPGIISKQTSDRPLSLLSRAYVPRVLLSGCSAVLVFFAPDFASSASLPLSFFAAMLVYVVAQSALSTAMFVSMMAFFAQVSDPAIGGTYMTLLNTIANLGNKWPNQLVLFLVDWITVKECVGGKTGGAEASCATYEQAEMCATVGGSCNTTVDGFYVLTAVCVAVGLVWHGVFRRHIEALQDAPATGWRVGDAVVDHKLN